MLEEIRHLEAVISRCLIFSREFREIVRNLIMQKSANNLFIDADSLGFVLSGLLRNEEILKLLSAANSPRRI